MSVNVRDELGDHVPPAYMTAVRRRAFYGFPFSYYGRHVDDRVKPQNPDMVAKAIYLHYPSAGAHGVLGSVLVRGCEASGTVTAWYVRGSAWVVEP